MTESGRFVGRWQVADTSGAVVAVDVLRAFTTAAYAFGAGVSHIASLVCASATARAVAASGLGEPTCVITGRFEDRPDRPGGDDLLTANLIERARLGQDLDANRTAEALATSDEAALTLALGHWHVHPDDIDHAVQVDRFDFAMEVTRKNGLLWLEAHSSP